jgi:DNA polymerase III delta prime subunit
MDKDLLLWVEKYRPRKIADCILPETSKAIFQNYADKKEIPNMILSGTPGIGKTTVARALCEEIGADYIVINASKERGISDIRIKVVGYASSVSLTGGRKVIILDEADAMTGEAQTAFRGVVEEFITNCSFILTCNHKNKIIPAIHSRCPPFDFKIPKEYAPKLAMEICKRIETILTDENIKFDQKAVVELVKKFFPDFRRVIGELQKYSITGKIDVGIFASLGEARVGEVISYLRQKDFRSMRKWVGVNSDQDATRILKDLYDKLSDAIKPEYVPLAVTIIGKWMYQDAFVADHEISLAACLTEIMIECETLSS